MFNTRTFFQVVTVDVMDVSGDDQDDIQDDVYKLRIDEHGRNISGDFAIKLGLYFVQFNI